MGPIVERSRLVLDHASTMYGLHVLLCILHGGVASTVNLLVMVLFLGLCFVTTQVGRYICMRSELLPIPLGPGAAAVPIGGQMSIATARLRALLPLLTGTIARLMQTAKRAFATEQPEVIPLTRLTSVPPSETAPRKPLV